jgi:sec-independent protein translocase protein TatA
MLSMVLLFLNIGGPEMILIIFVALLLFGGEKLPEIARGLGKGIRDFKDASEGVKREITNQINNYEEKKTETPTNTIEPAEPVKELPAATGEVKEEHTSTGPKIDANAVVPNTMTYVENHTSSTEGHSEVIDNTKTESVK